MKTILIFMSILLFTPVAAMAARGCCSHHGGVAYCDAKAGRQVCNDGTYSPSCTCQKSKK